MVYKSLTDYLTDPDYCFYINNWEIEYNPELFYHPDLRDTEAIDEYYNRDEYYSLAWKYFFKWWCPKKPLLLRRNIKMRKMATIKEIEQLLPIPHADRIEIATMKNSA